MPNTSQFYQLAQEFVLYTNRSLFVTGKAGTGKTTFLHKIKQQTQKQIAIVAPTGVAAINAGGSTIHSFFQLPFTPFTPTPEGKKNLIEKIKMQASRRKVIQELELLVIDEISMVRADILDAIDTILRHFRYRNQEPFGGVQLVFIGDMFQLSPVATDEETRILKTYYDSVYFFHSKVIQQQQPVYIEFDIIFRQSNSEFIQLLNQVRNNNLNDDSLQLLKSRYYPAFEIPSDETWITLTTHNYKADQINSSELAKIKSQQQSFEAKIEGEYPEKSYPTEKNLILKVGAKVMFLKNDTETPRRFYNGKIGEVENLENDSIEIYCPEDDQTVILKRSVWENIRYTTNPETKKIEENELGKFIQFPLRLAWAITIHKSQGLTFEKAVIDAGSAFAPGQVYVALSRCRTLDGMILLSNINPSSIQNDKLIVQHQLSKLSEETLINELNHSKDTYRKYIFTQLFNFSNIYGQAQQLYKNVSEHAGSFNEDTLPFIQNIIQQLTILQEVAAKFHGQLANILNIAPIDEKYLQERLDAASAFFEAKTNILVKTIHQSPAVTDSKTHASEYNDLLIEIFGNLAIKLSVFNGIKGKHRVEDYFILKNTFRMPELKLNTYAKNTAATKINTQHPALFHTLQGVRNSICEPNNLPIYLVASTQTLIEMSNYLPISKDDLLKISGFGPIKVEKYGQQFLDEIAKFTQENNIESRMDQLISKGKSSNIPKKKIGETFLITFEMHKQGMSITEIALSRNLTESTIINHLSKYIISGEINIDTFISDEKRRKAMQVMISEHGDSSVYELLSSFLSYIEVKMFLAWTRRNSQD